MSLANLLAIQRLQAFSAEPQAVQRLLEAAARNLADSKLAQLSAENRFDVAYKCIMQCAMLGLWVNGYRTSTHQPGHHQTALQSLPLTMGLPMDTVIVLDALRKRRNLSDYEGDPVTDAAVIECTAQAAKLLIHTRQWLRTKLPATQVKPKRA